MSYLSAFLKLYHALKATLKIAKHLCKLMSRCNGILQRSHASEELKTMGNDTVAALQAFCDAVQLALTNLP